MQGGRQQGKVQKVCAHCGKEISQQDIVKGFEYEKGKYVVMTDDDFERAKTEKDRTIHILHFTDLKNIRPIYYDKTYHALPEGGGDKAFELLRIAMLEEGKVAAPFGKVPAGNEKALWVRPELVCTVEYMADEGSARRQAVFKGIRTD